jgi:hypothetical protein
MSVFSIRASKDGQSTTTARLGIAATVGKAESLIGSGWEVHVMDAAGRQYGQERFADLFRSVDGEAAK